jgi:hypothetical protein
MSATAAAAGTPLEMIGGGEDDISILKVVIALGRGLALVHGRANFAEHRLGVIAIARDRRDGFETEAAEAARFEFTLRQQAQEMARHDDLEAPALAFVEMALGNPATVIAAAKGTLLTPAKAALRQSDRVSWRLRHGVTCILDLFATRNTNTTTSCVACQSPHHK